MPKRPPKKWMRSCISKVEEKGTVSDAGAVCGNTWYNRMTQSERNKAVRKEKKHKR